MAKRLGRRGVVAVATAAVVTGVVAGLVVRDHLWPGGRDGCRDVPLAPAVTPQTHPSALLWPFGAVQACRTVKTAAWPTGDVDASYVLVLETDRGPVLVRMDYYNLDAGRQFVAAATELSPASVDLPADEAVRIARAVQERGGLQDQPWTVHYGDG
jgi:hypothetical protein